MAKCPSDLDCLRNIDDKISLVGQVVTEYFSVHNLENSVLNVLHLLILILIILFLIFLIIVYVLIQCLFRSSRIRSIELRPLISEC